MCYTEEEISKFIEILKSDNSPPKSNKVSCKYCNCSDFFIPCCYYHCSNCFVSLGHVLGYYDKAEYERFYFRKQSIYQRKYHYQNNIKQVINKFKIVLSEYEQYQLYKKRMEINDEKLSKLNKKFKRKRLINIYYKIKQLLKSQGKQHEKIELNLSPETLKFYRKWIKYYQSI